MLKQIQTWLKENKIDGILIPSNDQFQSEFVPEHDQRLKAVTGFTGSAGSAIILQDKAAFFTDGRYVLQAEAEVPQAYARFNIAETQPWQWLKNQLTQEAVIAYDPWLYSQNQVAHYRHLNCTLQPLEQNPIDIFWSDRPAPRDLVIEEHPIEYTGQSSEEKLAQLRSKMKEQCLDSCVITRPDSICWLLNIRGKDVPSTPLVLSYLLVTQDALTLFVDTSRGQPKTAFEIRDLADLPEKLKRLTGRLLLEPATVPMAFYPWLEKTELVALEDPCLHPKACKNALEVEGMRQAHICDGVAVTKFIFWAKHKTAFTELDIDNKLLKLRQKQALFQGPSFPTIAGFAANGAVVHYRATEANHAIVKGDGLLLVDSGGQYFNGTTDITRTLAIGKASKAQQHHYTLVLKGHIALAKAIFPKGTTGSALDVLARKALWQEGLDYDHGTGHGVGSYLGVHEGPQRISKMASTVALEPGMVLSNEPGYYAAGEYGIRIESLVVVVEKSPGFYGFETLTMVPLEAELIDFSLLAADELEWLEGYQEKVKEVLGDYLDEEERRWLEGYCCCA